VLYTESTVYHRKDHAIHSVKSHWKFAPVIVFNFPNGSDKAKKHYLAIIYITPYYWCER